MNDGKRVFPIGALFITVLVLAPFAKAQVAQAPGAEQAALAAGRGGRGGGRGGPAVVSPEVLPDKQVVFRIYAPNAQNITLSAGDIPASARGAAPAPGAPAGPGRGGVAFTKNDQGVWEATVGPVPPGAFRYVYMVDGVRTLDPVNTALSESNTNNWSVFYVPGLDFMDDRPDVPHGAVSEIYYYSSVLKTMRRMHIYTPPGYEKGAANYPALYLLHGAGDCDDSWTSVGRAGFILDNLIASKRSVPMIVVMPAGHQPAAGAGRGGAPASAPTINPFTSEFMTDIMPYVEAHYRTLNDRRHRAIAGLSMGGSQTLDIAFTHLQDFADIGVFSSGAALGGRGRGAAPGAAAVPAAVSGAALAAAQETAASAWETRHAADLDSPALKKGTRLIWMSTGADDGLIASSRATVALLQKHGFSPVFKESQGAHTWLNWRNYLDAFAPQLFQ